jgi:hypothetical protein
MKLGEEDTMQKTVQLDKKFYVRVQCKLENLQDMTKAEHSRLHMIIDMSGKR